MLKASAGGGGKGMRRVESAERLAVAFRDARSEAAASFGDDAVYLEKFVDEPRHIEIQVMGDQHGKVVSLGERECSLQRRNQKVLEEAPSPIVGRDLRRRMGEAAVQAAKAVGYFSAGTVEFLVDKTPQLLFPRDEHPPPGRASGHRAGHRPRPRASAQILVAQGAALGPEFDDVEPRGHAIEVRLYAEDPSATSRRRPAASSCCAGRKAPACATTAGSTKAPRSRSTTTR